MEANETILQIKKTVIQVTINIPIIKFSPFIFKAKPSKTPKEVAIPFPPLNCRNIVQLWPQIQHKPMRIGKF